jgi:hypothetical protein
MPLCLFSFVVPPRWSKTAGKWLAEREAELLNPDFPRVKGNLKRASELISHHAQK